MSEKFATSKGKPARTVSLHNLNMRYLGNESMDSFGWVPISDYKSKAFEHFVHETILSNPFSGIYRYMRDYTGTLYVLMDKSEELYKVLNSEKAGTGIKDEIGATEVRAGKPIDQEHIPYQRDLQKEFPSYFKNADVVLRCLRGEALDPKGGIKLITNPADPIHYIEYASFIVEDLNFVVDPESGGLNAFFNCTGGVTKGITSQKAYEHAEESGHALSTNIIDMLEPPQQLSFQVSVTSDSSILNKESENAYKELLYEAIRQDILQKNPGFPVEKIKKANTRYVLIRKKAMEESERTEEETQSEEKSNAFQETNELQNAPEEHVVNKQEKIIPDEILYKINGYYIDFKRSGAAKTKAVYSIIGNDSLHDVVVDITKDGFTMYDFIDQTEGLSELQQEVDEQLPEIFGRMPFASNVMQIKEIPPVPGSVDPISKKLNIIYKKAVLSKIDVEALKAVYDKNQLDDIKDYYNKYDE